MNDQALYGRRILIVEDEYLIAVDLETALQDAGATVFGPVSDIERALEIATASFPLDGAVLDINLQGEMVFPAAAKLAEQNIPLVFVTGYEGRRIPEDFSNAPCLTKPFDNRALIENLATVIGSGPREYL